MPSLFQQTADGLTLYGVIEQVSTGLRWNTFTSALEAFNAAHWYGAGANNYSIAATKTVQSANIAAEYAVAVPALPAGNYTLWWYVQQGATPAVTDGQWIFRDDFPWNGSAIVDALAVENVTGNVNGKVLGGGMSVLVGSGVIADSVESPVTVSPGSGGDLVTISITDQTSGDPVAGARVWLTSDSAGHTVVAGALTTDASGHATFLLTAGSTYYLWMTATGQNSIEGTPFVAVRD
jgi:hypothetical protein